MWHAILPVFELPLAILLADVGRRAHTRCHECTCIRDHFQTGRIEEERGRGARAASGTESPLCVSSEYNGVGLDYLKCTYSPGL